MSFNIPKKLSTPQQRSSTRISSLESNKTLDDATKQLRRTKQLESLDQDNAHDDPHANIIWNKAAPRFDDELDPSSKKMKRDDKTASNYNSRKRRLARPEYNKQRFRKPFAVHVYEYSKSIADSAFPDKRRIDAYDKAAAPSSSKPPRKFCAVCGLYSKYCCTRCNSKYCSLSCRDVHNDTRCMKWLS